MLGYLFLSPIPNPWFESLFAANSQSTFIGLPPTKNKQLPLSGGWVRTNTERAHQTPQKKNNRNFCHVITFSVKHHIGQFLVAVMSESKCIKTYDAILKSFCFA